jgi:hypothetical protein
MWVIVWAIFLTHIAHTKSRASTSVWAFVGNVVILKQKLQITLYSTVYPYTVNLYSGAKNYCTKGVERFKFVFFIAHIAHISK